MDCVLVRQQSWLALIDLLSVFSREHGVVRLEGMGEMACWLTACLLWVHGSTQGPHDDTLHRVAYTAAAKLEDGVGMCAVMPLLGPAPSGDLDSMRGAARSRPGHNALISHHRDSVVFAAVQADCRRTVLTEALTSVSAAPYCPYSNMILSSVDSKDQSITLGYL